MISRSILRPALFAGFGALALSGAIALTAEPKVDHSHEGPQQPWSKWKVHDMERPVPPVVTPGTASTSEKPGKAPSDAIILFDGTDLSHWQAAGGGEPTFTLHNGEMLSPTLKNPRTTSIWRAKTTSATSSFTLNSQRRFPPRAPARDAAILAFSLWASSRSRCSTATKIAPMPTDNAAPSMANIRQK